MICHILTSALLIQHPNCDQMLKHLAKLPSTGWPGRQQESCLKLHMKRNEDMTTQVFYKCLLTLSWEIEPSMVSKILCVIPSNTFQMIVENYENVFEPSQTIVVIRPIAKWKSCMQNSCTQYILGVLNHLKWFRKFSMHSNESVF